MSVNKGNNKIIELRTTYKGKVKTHKYINRQISQQPDNCENRNDPDLVQAFLKKWWVESDFKVPNLPYEGEIFGKHIYTAILLFHFYSNSRFNSTSVWGGCRWGTARFYRFTVFS